MITLYYCTWWLLLFLLDQLAISVIPVGLTIGKGKTAEFTAVVTGISTKENKFIYQWKKRGNNLPDKVSGVQETILTIPNVTESDEGQYYCNVTNEWGRSVESNDITLSIFGMLIVVITYCVMDI